MTLNRRDRVSVLYRPDGTLCDPSTAPAPAAGSQEPDVRSTGTLAAATAGATVTIPINGQATLGMTYVGLTGTGATLTYEQSIEGGTTWTGIDAVNRGPGVPEGTRTTDGQIALSATGRTHIRVRVSTTGTGTISVARNVSAREGIMSLGSPLPPGANAIGGVTQSGMWTFGLSGPIPAGSNVIGAVTQSGGPWSISAASLPLPVGAATAAGQTAQQGSVAPGTAAASSVLGGQIYNTSPPAPTNGQQLALQSDGAGNLKIANATLPPGAATAVKQPALGTAGLPSADVITVQGAVGGTPQPVAQQDGSVPAGSPFSASSAATLFSVDTTGYQSLAVQLTGTFSATVSYEISNDNSTWVAAVGQQTTSIGNVVPAASDSAPALRLFQVSARYFRARVSSYASGTVVAVPVLRAAPLAPIGVGVNNVPGVYEVATTASGGVTGIARLPSSAATTNLTQVKAGAGRVYKLVACNTTTTPARFKLYNAPSASVTVGTTAPFLTRPIPAAAAAGGLACASYDMAGLGWSLSAGITYALTTGAADNDATAVAAGAVTDLSVEYQ